MSWRERPNQDHHLSVWAMPTEWGFGCRPVKSEWCKQTNRNHRVYTSAGDEQLSSLRHAGVVCYLDERKTIMEQCRKMESWDMFCSSQGQVHSLMASFSAISNRGCQLLNAWRVLAGMIWVKYSQSFHLAISATISGRAVLGLNHNCCRCTITTWKCWRVGHRLPVVYSTAYGFCPRLRSLERLGPGRTEESPKARLCSIPAKDL